MVDPYDVGYEGYFDGTRNPYLVGSNDWKDYEDGWNDAQLDYRDACNSV